MTSQYIRSRFSSLREYLAPINHTSTFATSGEITPEEFVIAGDYLVYRFPTWQWSPADNGKEKSFLPKDKQFLVTRHVPSYVRASDYEMIDEDDEILIGNEDIGDDSNDSNNKNNNNNNNNGDGWSIAGSSSSGKKLRSKSIASKLGSDDGDNVDEASIKEISDDEEDDINDIDDLIDENAEDVEFVDTHFSKGNDNNNKLSKTNSLTTQSSKRYYDLYISYSTSYRVPKMYMVGFNSDSIPLTPTEMFEDIASDYRHKTVTIEKLPFLSNTTAVSIHPCKHATVMKVLMKRSIIAAQERKQENDSKLINKISKLGINNNDDDGNNNNVEDDWEELKDEKIEGIRVDQYLIVFLKFISSVTPGIEHDYTMEAL